MASKLPRVILPAGAFVLALLGPILLAQTSPTLPPEHLRIQPLRSSDWEYFPGDYTRSAVIGNSLPGTWRPFTPESPWNTAIQANPPIHADSVAVMATLVAAAPNVRLAKSFAIPVWIVNQDNVPLVRVRSDMIFDTWDRDRDGWSDIGIPLTPEMWGEASSDGHMCIIDPFKRLAYEMSKFARLADGTPTCTTFNVWATDGHGYGDPNEGQRWQTRGGRGSGFAEIAGLLRPEELTAGEIRHALAFTFPTNRQADDGSNIFIHPACRSDGRYPGNAYPIEGMRLQLDPALTEADFDAWGLSREGKIVARALQQYGMLLGDNGGAMAIEPQLLGPTGDENYAEWERRFPGFYKNVERIPTSRFRVIDTGPATIKR